MGKSLIDLEDYMGSRYLVSASPSMRVWKIFSTAPQSKLPLVSSESDSSEPELPMERPEKKKRKNKQRISCSPAMVGSFLLYLCQNPIYGTLCVIQ